MRQGRSVATTCSLDPSGRGDRGSSARHFRSGRTRARTRSSGMSVLARGARPWEKIERGNGPAEIAPVPRMPWPMVGEPAQAASRKAHSRGGPAAVRLSGAGRSRPPLLAAPATQGPARRSRGRRTPWVGRRTRSRSTAPAVLPVAAPTSGPAPTFASTAHTGLRRSPTTEAGAPTFLTAAVDAAAGG